MMGTLFRHACWAMPLVLFLILRLFPAEPYYLLGGDQCTFLQMGRTFPRHALFNHELYLMSTANRRVAARPDASSGRTR
jgi:hypothetical protein